METNSVTCITSLSMFIIPFFLVLLCYGTHYLPVFLLLKSLNYCITSRSVLVLACCCYMCHVYYHKKNEHSDIILYGWGLLTYRIDWHAYVQSELDYIMRTLWLARLRNAHVRGPGEPRGSRLLKDRRNGSLLYTKL